MFEMGTTEQRCSTAKISEQRKNNSECRCNFELTSEDMNLITNMETCGFSGYYIDENME